MLKSLTQNLGHLKTDFGPPNNGKIKPTPLKHYRSQLNFCCIVPPTANFINFSIHKVACDLRVNVQTKLVLIF